MGMCDRIWKFSNFTAQVSCSSTELFARAKACMRLVRLQGLAGGQIDSFRFSRMLIQVVWGYMRHLLSSWWIDWMITRRRKLQALAFVCETTQCKIEQGDVRFSVFFIADTRASGTCHVFFVQLGQGHVFARDGESASEFAVIKEAVVLLPWWMCICNSQWTLKFSGLIFGTILVPPLNVNIITFVAKLFVKWRTLHRTKGLWIMVTFLFINVRKRILGAHHETDGRGFTSMENQL